MAEVERRDSNLGLDLGTSGGDWLFKRGDQVFGPIPAKVLVAMLYRGEVSGVTPVCSGDSGDGRYQQLGEIGFFVIHVKKAEAQIRVQHEITDVRRVQQRKGIFRMVAVAFLAMGLLAGGAYGAWWLALNKPWEHKSALLEDFGDGIVIASAARIGGKHEAAEEEVEMPAGTSLPPGQPTPSRRSKAARPSPTPSGATAAAPSRNANDLTVAQYDQGNIQSTIAREQHTLAPCVKAEARRSPDFTGEIPLEFAIGNDGRVAQLWIDSPRFKHGELYECLLKTLQTWAFKSFPGERPTVSLSFRIKGR